LASQSKLDLEHIRNPSVEPDAESGLRIIAFVLVVLGIALVV
jgi:hypothetical protein